jgi:peptidyl-prolyl cis-trans isomerase A (cyclophilin A)
MPGIARTGHSPRANWTRPEDHLLAVETRGARAGACSPAVMRKMAGAVMLSTCCLLAGCHDHAANRVQNVIDSGSAPDSFTVDFRTTRGTFTVVAHRSWAPIGVDRFYRLVQGGVLDDNSFFRVLPRFIVQFGASGDPKVNARWDSLKIADDPPVKKNLRGTIAFAQDGPGSRTHQLFVNLADNAHLDGQGFVPIGEVVEGMGVVDAIYSDYRERPDYNLISSLGNSYLHRMFPKLDYIQSAVIVP